MTRAKSIKLVTSPQTPSASQRDVKRESLWSLPGKVNRPEKLPRICDTRTLTLGLDRIDDAFA